MRIMRRLSRTYAYAREKATVTRYIHDTNQDDRGRIDAC
jgi:hypothetical protein